MRGGLFRKRRFLVKAFGDEHFAGAVCDTFRFRKIKSAAGETARHGHGFSRIYDSLAAEFCQKPKANLLVDSDFRRTQGEHERASRLSNSNRGRGGSACFPVHQLVKKAF